MAAMLIPARHPIARAAAAWPTEPHNKPSVPMQIDWDNPLTQALSSFVISTGGRHIDLMDGHVGVHGTISVGSYDDRHGESTRLTRGTPGAISTNAPESTTGEYSCVMTFRALDLQAANNAEILASTREVQSGNRGWSLYLASPSGVAPNRMADVSLVHYGVGVYLLSDNQAGLDNTIVTLGLSADVSSQARAYLDGGMIGSKPIGALRASATPIHYGDDVIFNPAKRDIEIFVGATWDRSLSAEEQAQVADLYTLLKPANQSPFLVTAGSASGVTLVVAGSSHGHSADSAELSQQSSLTADDASHAQTADQTTLNAGSSLSVSGAAHGHAAEQPSIMQFSIIAPDDAAHSTLSDSPGLSQSHVVAVMSAAHSHLADGVTLTVSGSLSLDHALHGHIVDTPALSQASQLQVNSGDHSHMAEALTLNAGGSLSPDDARHLHIAGSQSLVQDGQLQVDGAIHTQGADALGLAQDSTISPAGAVHGHVSASPLLDFSVLLSPSDTQHGHSAESLALIQSQLLAVSNALHAQSSGDVGLAQHVTLVASDALHAHLADNVGLISGSIQTPDGRVFLIGAEPRIFVIQ